MKFTNNEKTNGELAVRRMSDKARKVYEETDPCTVAEYLDDEDVFYFVDVCGNNCDRLTFEEAEQFLEDNFVEEKDEEDDI